MNTQVVIAFVIAALMIGGAIWIVSSDPSDFADGASVVSIIDGTQYVDVAAKGGYSPRIIEARANIPTVVRVATRGTFDCSASLVIPKLSYQKFLQPSGTEEIKIAAAQAQGTIQGLCAMGMYNFEIRFQ